MVYVDVKYHVYLLLSEGRITCKYLFIPSLTSTTEMGAERGERQSLGGGGGGGVGGGEGHREKEREIRVCVRAYCLLGEIFMKVLFVQMYINVTFVITCLYRTVSLTMVRE